MVSLLIAGALLAGTAAAGLMQVNRLVPPPLVDEKFGTADARESSGQAVFQQLIDHSDPSLGTFSQRYWWSDEFYAGPGSPIVLNTPGEVAADGYTGYLTTRAITGRFAQTIGGAVVILEHRYWGSSSPVAELTTKNMRYLTLNNSIHDLTHFARSVRLPFDVNGTSSADKAPWVLSGGSYAGALAGWVAAVAPGTFWAYHASSAVVEAVGDFWQYFHPVQEGMPRNCSADVSRVVEHVDKTLMTGSDAEKQALKEKFGLGEIEHDDDFASTIENGPWLWQGHSPASGYSEFFRFCDYVENAIRSVFPNSSGSPGPEGVGLKKALDGYAKYTKDIMLPGFCAGFGYWTDDNDLSCFDSYNASSPFFTDTSLGNAIDRQWQWFLCNEPFKYWQNGAPEGTPTLVSRLVDSAYWERQCALFFPPEDGVTYGIALGRNEDEVNAFTGGWFADTERLSWVNGEWDPWKDATVSSDFRPGGPLPSTPKAPVDVIPGGIHCSDLITRNAEANAGVRAVVEHQLQIIKGWVDEFPRK